MVAGLYQDHEILASVRARNRAHGIFTVVRTEYDYERDTDLAVVQTRLYFAPRNDSLLDTETFGNVADLRYPTEDLEAQLAANQPAAVPPPPSSQPSDRPDCGTLNAVSFNISNLYLPEADLSGDRYSPEPSPEPSPVQAVSGSPPCTLNEEPEDHQKGESQSDEAFTSPTARKYWKELDAIPVFRPRSSVLMTRSPESIETPGFSRALHGNFLASLQQEASPEDSAKAARRLSNVERIQPVVPGQSSPKLRQNVSSRNRVTSEVLTSSPNGDLANPHHLGPHLVNEVLPQNIIPVTGIKRQRTNDSSMSSSLALALDLDPGVNYFENFWQSNQERRLALSPDGRFDPAAAPSSVLSAASPPPPGHSTRPRSRLRPPVRQQPTRLVKKQRRK